MSREIKSLHCFLFYFFFAVVSGLIVQMILPIYFPDTFKDGLMISIGDSVFFHQLGRDYAKNFMSNGLTLQWDPTIQLPGYILGIVYFMSGIISPLWQLPLNGFFLGLTAVTFLRVLPKNSWCHLALFIALCTPTSMGWITQISKDIYIGLGVSLLFVGTFEILIKKDYKSIILVLMGFLILFLFKSHWYEVLLVGILGLFSLCFLDPSLRSKRNIFVAVSLVLLSLIGIKAGRIFYSDIKPGIKVKADATRSISPDLVKSESEPVFEYRESFPVVDKVLMKLGYAHFRFTYMFSHGREKYFPDWKMNSAFSVISYIPLAYFFGLFDPLPFKSRWDQGLGKGLLFLVLQLEILFFYAAFFILVRYFSSLPHDLKLFAIGWFFLVSLFIIVFGFVSPNMGAINRYRFPFLMTLKVLSFIVWDIKGKKHE